MRNTIVTLVVATIAFVSSFGQTEIVNGVPWSYWINEGEAWICQQENRCTIYQGHITIPSELGGFPVTTINFSAFDECKYLESVTIPNSVRYINNAAFSGCSSLSTISIPNSITNIGNSAFRDCTALQTIDIPSSVTVISDGAFCGCSRLKELTIPETVLTIGRDSFADCINLTEVTIPLGVEPTWGAFDGCTGIGKVSISGKCTLASLLGDAKSSVTNVCILDGSKNLSDWMFAYCGNLTTVSIPDSVTNIGFQAFFECTSLARINIPTGVVCICESSFSGCTGLTSIILPRGTKSIGAYAFSRCSGLRSVEIPLTIDDIGYGIFNGCVSLENLTIPGNVPLSMLFGLERPVRHLIITDGETSITNQCFSGEPNIESIHIPNTVTNIGSWAFGFTSIPEISIPSSVKSIGDHAFYQCTNLWSIVLENGIETIGHDAFGFCSALQTVQIPSSCHVISHSLFWGCTNLSEITIPCGVETIEADAFYACSSLQSISLPQTLSSIGDHSFLSCSNLVSVVLPDSVISIGTWAFAHCPSLRRLRFEGNVPTFGYSLLESSSSSVVSLPAVEAHRRYSYWKTASAKLGLELIWIEGDMMSTTFSPEPVPFSYFENDYPSLLVNVKGDMESAAMSSAANGRAVWECYVSGTDPTNPDDRFTATIAMENGSPVIDWIPKLSDVEASKRKYIVWGKTSLSSAEEWVEVPAGEEARFNFFRVTVEMR